jgi:hypothetical protein
MFTVHEITEYDIPCNVIRLAFEGYGDRFDPPSSAHHKASEIVSVRREFGDGEGFVVCDLQAITGCVFYHINPHHLAEMGESAYRKWALPLMLPQYQSSIMSHDRLFSSGSIMCIRLIPDAGQHITNR